MKIQYDSLTDFYKDAKMTKQIEGPDDKIETEKADWIGIATKSEILKNRYSFEKVVNYAADVKTIYTTKKVTTWNSDDGDDMDPERYIEERPFMSRRVRVRGDRHNKGASKRIIINAAVPHTVSAEAMISKACAAMKIADDIEQQGVATEVYVAFNLKQPWRNKTDDAEILIKVKKAGGQVGAGIIGAALAPWFLRVWIFGWIEKRGTPAAGYGKPRKLRESNIIEDAVVIEMHDCETKESAEEFIKQVEA